LANSSRVENGHSTVFPRLFRRAFTPSHSSPPSPSTFTFNAILHETPADFVLLHLPPCSPLFLLPRLLPSSFPCTNVNGDGTFSADDTKCLSGALIAPGADTTNTEGNQGDGVTPTDPVCSIEAATGAYFCGE
jgi:hypothetical protein